MLALQGILRGPKGAATKVSKDSVSKGGSELQKVAWLEEVFPAETVNTVPLSRH